MVWLAALASNLGTWMQVVAASWMMTSLTASAALVALVQTLRFPVSLWRCPPARWPTSWTAGG